MSSTSTTQYYGLTQYIGTDKPDWTDNNEAFAAIDGDLHEVVQSSEGFSTDITALQEAQSALTTEVTGLEADLNTEKAKITALQNKETLQDAAIADVKADALDMIAAVDEGTAQVATVAVNEGKYFRYNDVLYMATTNIAVGDTIVPNTNCRATNVGTELEGQAEDIAEVKSDLSHKVDNSKLNWGVVKASGNIADNTSYEIANISDLDELSVTFIIETASNEFRKTSMHLVVDDIFFGASEQYLLTMYENSGGTEYSATLQFYFSDATHINVFALTHSGWSPLRNILKIKGR